MENKLSPKLDIEVKKTTDPTATNPYHVFVKIGSSDQRLLEKLKNYAEINHMYEVGWEEKLLNFLKRPDKKDISVYVAKAEIKFANKKYLPDYIQSGVTHFFKEEWIAIKFAEKIEVAIQKLLGPVVEEFERSIQSNFGKPEDTFQ